MSSDQPVQEEEPPSKEEAPTDDNKSLEKKPEQINAEKSNMSIDIDMMKMPIDMPIVIKPIQFESSEELEREADAMAAAAENVMQPFVLFPSLFDEAESSGESQDEFLIAARRALNLQKKPVVDDSMPKLDMYGPSSPSSTSSTSK